MDWTAEDTREVARRRLKKEAERQHALEQRRIAAQAHATQLAQEIGEADATVRRIWGFGSVFDQRLNFREGSDIDLAVQGGSLRAWKLAQQSEWQIDWVELDDQDESMARSIQASGVVLYER